MIRIALTFAAMLLAAAGAMAQVTAKSAFSLIPNEVIAGLPEANRLDMLDYYEAGIERGTPDFLDAHARITSMTDDMMTFVIGDHTEFTIVTLPYGREFILMLISRLKDSATDSQIKFYTTRWEPIDPKGIFAEPTLADWTGKISKADRVALEKALPFLMYDAQYDPSTAMLTLNRSIGDYVFIEDRDLVNRLVKPAVTLRWDGKKFR